MKNITLGEIILISVIILLLGYVYIGFYFPDPYQTAGRSGTYVKWFLLGIKILYPVIMTGLVILYIGSRSGRIHRFSLLVTFVSTLAAIWILYPAANFIYRQWYEKKFPTTDFHPYLQLSPAQFHLRETVPNHHRLVICLGGSTTEFVDRSGKGWVGRVEDQVRAELGDTGIDFYNQGRQWYTSLHSLIRYETTLRHYHPDVLIVMQSINDLLQNADFSYFSHGPFREDYGHFYGPVARLVPQESLFDMLKNVVATSWYHRPRTMIDTDNFPGLKSYERNLRMIIETARHDSTRVVLMTEPFLLKEPATPEESAVFYMVNREAIGPDRQWTVATAIRGMNAYNDVMRRLAQEYDIVLIDLERYVPKTLEYFVDEVHYSEKAYDFISPYICQELVKNAGNLFPESKDNHIPHSLK